MAERGFREVRQGLDRGLESYRIVKPKPGIKATMVLRSAAMGCFRLLIPAAILLVVSAARAEVLYDTPVYNPDTQSYFELVRVRAGHSIRGKDIPAITWGNARKLARGRVYKGARGRLAVVKSQEVSDFLRRTFQADEKAWIGLRYWCAYNRLQWVTGEFYALSEYANWDRIWNHEGGIHGETKQPVCNAHFRYWPVHYWPVQDGFRWNANGMSKEARSFFLEYPTGKE